MNKMGGKGLGATSKNEKQSGEEKEVGAQGSEHAVEAHLLAQRCQYTVRVRGCDWGGKTDAPLLHSNTGKHPLDKRSIRFPLPRRPSFAGVVAHTLAEVVVDRRSSPAVARHKPAAEGAAGRMNVSLSSESCCHHQSSRSIRPVAAAHSPAAARNPAAAHSPVAAARSLAGGSHRLGGKGSVSRLVANHAGLTLSSELTLLLASASVVLQAHKRQGVSVCPSHRCCSRRFPPNPLSPGPSPPSSPRSVARPLTSFADMSLPFLGKGERDVRVCVQGPPLQSGSVVVDGG